MKTKLKPAPWRDAPEYLVDRVERFQRARGLQIDGIAGVQTVDELLRELKVDGVAGNQTWGQLQGEIAHWKYLALQPAPPPARPWGWMIAFATAALLAAVALAA